MTLTAFFGQPVKGPSTPPPAPRPSSADQQALSAVKVVPSKGVVKTGTGSSHAKYAKSHPKYKAAGSSTTQRQAISTPTKKGVSGKSKPKLFTSRSKVVTMGKGSVTSEWTVLRQVGLKSPKSAYTLWSGENRKRIQDALGSTKFAEVSRAVGQEWGLLTEEQKKPYYKNAELLRNKYTEARKAYDEYLTTTIKRDTKARETKKKHGGPKVVIKHLSKLQTTGKGKKITIKTPTAKKIKKSIVSPPKPQSLFSLGATTTTNEDSAKAVEVQDEDTKQTIELQTLGPVESAAMTQLVTPIKRSMNSFRIPKDEQPAPFGDIPLAKDDELAPTEEKPAAEDDELAPTEEKPAAEDDEPVPMVEEPAAEDDEPVPMVEEPAATPVPMVEEPAAKDVQADAEYEEVENVRV